METRPGPSAPAPPWRLPGEGWLLLGALLFHLLFLPAPGYDRDLYWFGRWMRASVEHGVSQVAGRPEPQDQYPWCDYPPGYLYLLKGLGWTHNLLLGPLQRNVEDALQVGWMKEFEARRDPDRPPRQAEELRRKAALLRFFLKLIPILSNLAGAWVIGRIAAPRLSAAGALAAVALYAFNPAMVFNGAVWGQVDSLTGLVLLLASWALLSGLPLAAFALAAAAILVKYQAVIVLPAFLLASYRLHGGRGMRAAYLGIVLGGVLVLFPFISAGRVGPVIETAFQAVGRYPNISMNAHNVWWLHGMWKEREKPPEARNWPNGISDEHRVGNAALTCHGVGQILFIGACAIILWRMWRETRKAAGPGEVAEPLFRTLALLTLAFYLFPTQMHERYIVPVLAPLAATLVFRPSLKVPFALLSLAVAVSLASTLNATYPHGMGGLGEALRSLGWIAPLPVPGAAAPPPTRWETEAVALVFLGLFFVILFWSCGPGFAARGASAAALFACLLAAYATFPRKGSVLLSSLRPVEWRQQWGNLEFDKSVGRGRLGTPGGFLYRRGLGTHANGYVKYHLNGAFREFESLFGRDNEANPSFVIQFRVLTAAKGVPEPRAASRTPLEIGRGPRTFALEGGRTFRAGTRIRATAAAEPGSAMEGSVTLSRGGTVTVDVDGASGAGTFEEWNLDAVLLKTIFDTGPTIGRHYAGYTGKLDIRGAEYLILEVLDGGDGNDSDHGDWLEPILYR